MARREYKFDEELYYLYEVTTYNDNGVKVYVDDSFEMPSARRPYYQMRGKPVTQHQAFDILKRTDAYYMEKYGKKLCENEKDDYWIGFNYFYNDWFISNSFLAPEFKGWVNAEGYVGKKSSNILKSLLSIILV